MDEDGKETFVTGGALDRVQKVSNSSCCSKKEQAVSFCRTGEYIIILFHSLLDLGAW